MSVDPAPVAEPLAVRGNPSAVETAAALAAVLAAGGRPADESPYRRWRAVRRAALGSARRPDLRSGAPGGPR